MSWVLSCKVLHSPSPRPPEATVDWKVRRESILLLCSKCTPHSQNLPVYTHKYNLFHLTHLSEVILEPQKLQKKASIEVSDSGLSNGSLGDVGTLANRVLNLRFKMSRDSTMEEWLARSSMHEPRVITSVFWQLVRLVIELTFSDSSGLFVMKAVCTDLSLGRTSTK